MDRRNDDPAGLRADEKGGAGVTRRPASLAKARTSASSPTSAPVADGDVTPRIHGALQGCELLPSKHIVDTGYVDAEWLVESRWE